MDLSIAQHENSIIITIVGNIDEYGAQTLKETFLSAYESSIKTVVFDFKNVDHIGSAGIGKLLLIYKNVGINGGKIRIENTPKTIYDFLLMLKLDSVFSIERS